MNAADTHVKYGCQKGACVCNKTLMLIRHYTIVWSRTWCYSIIVDCMFTTWIQLNRFQEKFNLICDSRHCFQFHKMHLQARTTASALSSEQYACHFSRQINSEHRMEMEMTQMRFRNVEKYDDIVQRAQQGRIIEQNLEGVVPGFPRSAGALRGFGLNWELKLFLRTIWVAKSIRQYLEFSDFGTSQRLLPLNC